MSGAVFIQIANRGSKPAEEVFIRVKGARKYRLVNGSSTIRVDDVEGDPLRIGALNQGHKVQVVAWTFSDISDALSFTSDDIIIGHKDGTGVIRGIKSSRVQVVTYVAEGVGYSLLVMLSVIGIGYFSYRIWNLFLP